MTTPMRHIEIDCDERGCVVVGVSLAGERLDMSPRLTPFTARDHALGKAEFWRCRVVSSAATRIEPTPVRTQRWGR